MYGMLTTGKPVKIVSMTSPKKPAHYFEIQIDTRRNMPEIINGKGDGEDIPPVRKARSTLPTMVSNGYRTIPFWNNGPIITMKCAAARVSRSSSKDVTNAGAAVWTNI